jgi:uncharacterized protein (TIGR02421 family)
MDSAAAPGPSPDRGPRAGRGKGKGRGPGGPAGKVRPRGRVDRAGAAASPDEALPRWGTACILPPRGRTHDSNRQDSYRSFLRRISVSLVRAQKEIRVLKALHWPDRVGRRFIAGRARELPRIEYAPLGFDPRKKSEDLRTIEELLDPGDPLQAVLRDTARQYRDVVRMLEARGTRGLYDASRDLYGHPLETFAGQTTTSLDLARHLDGILGDGSDLVPREGRLLSAPETAELLQRRMGKAFRGAVVRVEVSNLLTADAAAGANRIRIKRGRLFGHETVDYLEQHEGYVHLATTLNGRRQPVLPILGKASPRAVRVNEGLAVFSEWASHTMTLRRLRRLVDRVLAIRMAEEGADFLEVYRQFLDRGEPPPAAFDIARRVFRGGDLRGGAPFTKDASYLGDFLRIYNFTRVAAKRRRMDLLVLLFAGKVTLQDIPVLSRHVLTGEVRPPRYLPPWMRHRDWLTAHMAISSFLDAVRLSGTEGFYENLFAQCADPPPPVERKRPRPRKERARHYP